MKLPNGKVVVVGANQYMIIMLLTLKSMKTKIMMGTRTWNPTSRKKAKTNSYWVATDTAVAVAVAVREASQASEAELPKRAGLVAVHVGVAAAHAAVRAAVAEAGLSPVDAVAGVAEAVVTVGANAAAAGLHTSSDMLVHTE